VARKSTKRGPQEIDIRVGSRIRLRRKMLGMSQTELARQIGVTFQQVQKYEKGANRIGTSRHICAVLKIAPAGLLQGVAGPPPRSDADRYVEEAVAAFEKDGTAPRLMLLWGRLPPQVKRSVLKLMTIISND
jgi:transcriptional regulator with XRE-family HTH domain